MNGYLHGPTAMVGLCMSYYPIYPVRKICEDVSLLRCDERTLLWTKAFVQVNCNQCDTITSEAATCLAFPTVGLPISGCCECLHGLHTELTL